MKEDELSASCPFPAGHFYSPIVDVRDVYRRRAEIWPEHPVPLGIDFNDASHRAILTEVFPRHLADYDYPDRIAGGEDAGTFYTDNPTFSWLDARALFVLLREWRPKRLVEVGGGFSTLLAADVNERFLSGSVDITCIEPYPRSLRRSTAAKRALLDFFRPAGSSTIANCMSFLLERFWRPKKTAGPPRKALPSIFPLSQLRSS
jgi:hypothetical protein